MVLGTCAACAGDLQNGYTAGDESSCCVVISHMQRLIFIHPSLALHSITAIKVYVIHIVCPMQCIAQCIHPCLPTENIAKKSRGLRCLQRQQQQLLTGKTAPAAAASAA
jgi:hypothetical protein